MIAAALTAYGLWEGKRLPDAAARGVVAAVPGLAAWGVYHFVSRRNDGLAFLVLNTFTVFKTPVRTPGDLVRVFVIGLLVLTSTALLAGLYFRHFRRDKPTHDSA